MTDLALRETAREGVWASDAKDRVVFVGEICVGIDVLDAALSVMRRLGPWHRRAKASLGPRKLE